MTAVAVTFDGVLLSAAESASDGGVWDKAGSSQTPTQESDFLWQGSFAQSNKSSNNTAGVEFEDDVALDYTTPKVALAKILMATPGSIDLTVAKGLWYELGEGANGGTWQYFYYLNGLYAGPYPARLSWQVIAIDPNEIAWRDEVAGTVDLTTLDYYALNVTTNALAKSDNIVHDRLDYLTNGGGLTLLGGDGADPPGTLDDFVDFDFGDDTATGRPGVVLPGEDEIIVNGVLSLGNTGGTAARLIDSNRFLVWPHHLVGEGFGGLDIHMTNAANDFQLTAYTLKGKGNASVKRFFDTALQVNGTTEVITVPAHGWNTGDLVTYSNEGGTNLTGLTTTTQYFVRAITVDTVALYAIGATVGRQNSFSDTTRVGLTADTAPGENHSLIRGPDTRPDHEVAGTTGVGHEFNSCSVDGCRILTFTDKSAMNGGFILRTGNIVLSTGDMTGVDVSTPTLEEGAALFDPLPAASIAGLSGMTFNASDEGHVMRLSAIGTASWDHDLVDYWTPADLGWNFITSQAFTSEQINMDANHGFVTGEAVYYNDEGGVQGIGLTDGAKYYVNVVDADTVTLHATRAAAVAGSSAINLTTSGAETQSLYSGRAAVFNDSAGEVTLTVAGGSTPSVRNGIGATTIVVANAVTLLIHCVTRAGVDIPNVRVQINGTTTAPVGPFDTTDGLIAGLTDVNGEISDTRVYSANQNIVGIARQASPGDSPKYQQGDIIGQVSSINGLTVTVVMIPDE